MDGGESRYELVELIGSGGMAEVYRARMVGAVGFEKQVAIKRLLPHVNADQEFVQRFVDEARLTARLVHPNICQILDFGTMDGCYFIAMEYVDGLDLAGVLKGMDREGERIPVDVALYVICGVLRGLKHAHEASDDDGRPLSIVHRDVSPHNVLLSINGDIKLSDLGAATASQSFRSARTEKHFRIGKVLYMAPEQRRRKPVDARADLYSAGILLVEMILGSSEFHQEANMFLAGMCSLWEKVSNRLSSPLGQSLAQVVERALAEDPARRYQSADGMLSELEGLLVEYAPGTSVDRVARHVQRLKRRRPARRADEPPADEARGAEPGEDQLADLQPQDEMAAGAPSELEDVLTVARPNAPLRSRSIDAPAPEPAQAGGAPNPFDDGGETLIQTTLLRRDRQAAAPAQTGPEAVWADRTNPSGPTPPYLDYVVEELDPPLSGPPTSPDVGTLASAATQEARSGEPPAYPAPPTRRQRYDDSLSGQAQAYEEDLPAPPTAQGRIGRPPRRRGTLVAAILVPIVLVLGVSFGGVLAVYLFPALPPGEPAPRGPGLSKASQGELISTSPGIDAATEAGPGPAVAPEPPPVVELDAAPPEVRVPQKAPEPVVRAPDPVARPPEPVVRPPEPEPSKREGRGYLNINSRPFGIPYVDGRQIGSETPVANYPVAPGRHLVRVQFPQNGQVQERQVEVVAGEPTGVTIVMQSQ
jgi:serine/threonine protein kinase